MSDFFTPSPTSLRTRASIIYALSYFSPFVFARVSRESRCRPGLKINFGCEMAGEGGGIIGTFGEDERLAGRRLVIFHA